MGSSMVIVILTSLRCPERGNTTVGGQMESRGEVSSEGGVGLDVSVLRAAKPLKLGGCSADNLMLRHSDPSYSR